MANPVSAPSFSKGRKWSVGLNVGISILALLALVIMANYLGARHNRRFYLADSSGQPLSPLTLRVLNALTNKVKVIVFFDRREPLFTSVASMMREYQGRCPNLDVEFVDYQVPGRAEEVRSEYQLTSPSEGNRVIFDCNHRVRSVLGTELSDYDFSSLKEIRRNSFKGEQLFTSAILNVTEARQLRAYILQGHGEHSPSSTDDYSGYRKFAKLLMDNNVEVFTLGPLVGQEIPPDCQLLIVPGPTTVFAQEELDRIDMYLSQGGRLFALFNMFRPDSPKTGLEKLLSHWNVEVGFNQVKDRAQSRANQPAELIASSFGAHPIVKPLLRSSLYLVVPRSVSQRAVLPQTADTPKVTELVFTGREGLAVGNFDANPMGSVERKEAIPLMVAVEKGGIQGMTADRGATRMVIAGNSAFLGNIVIEQAANRDFANLAVNWLLNRDVLLNEISPRASRDYHITVTEKQMSRLRWIFLAALPGAVVLMGVIVWFRRRI